MRRNPMGTAAVVAAGVGFGLVPAGVGRADPAPTTQPVDLTVDVRCQDTQRGIDVPGSVRATGTAPASVAPGERFTLTVAVTASLPQDAPLRPVGTQLQVMLENGGSQGGPELPVDGSRQSASFTAPASTSSPVRIRFSNFGTLTAATEDGETVYCRSTGTGPVLAVPVVVPGDGSVRSFDLVATADCGDERGRYQHTFELHGVAPARVAPGTPVALSFDYVGLASQLSDFITLRATGVSGGSQELKFSGTTGTRNVHVATAAAAAEGSVSIAFAHVSSSLQAMNPPHVNAAECSFPEPNPSVSIPIVAGSDTTTSTSTTTTRTTTHRSTDWLHWLLCRLFGRC